MRSDRQESRRQGPARMVRTLGAATLGAALGFLGWNLILQEYSWAMVVQCF